jgi:glutamate formiminotransferase/formiminotetrahydrofolate cyclodeaminase
MQVASEAFPLLEAMAREGNPASVSDAGVGACCARAAVLGAWLNVRINLPGLDDPGAAAAILQEGQRLVRRAEEAERAILEIVEGKIGK